MKIGVISSTKNSVNPLSFQAKIIDAHAHLGKIWDKNYGIDSLDKFIKEPISVHVNNVTTKDTIEKMIVSSGSAVTGELDELVGNKQLLGIIRGRKEYLPIAVCQPAKTAGNISNIKKLFEAHPEFSGLKFHPTFMPIQGDVNFTNAYLPYMEFAKSKNLPCLFHCQGGDADAYKIYELAKKTPKVPVILGHSGSTAGEGIINRTHAIEVFEKALTKKDANIYLDLSWVDWTDQGFPQKNQPDVKRILNIAKENNGINKILFGTDAPLGCFGEWESPHFNNKTCYSDAVSYFKQSISDVFGKDAEKVSNKIFYENANNIFKPSSKPSIAKNAIIAFAGVAFLAAICKLASGNNKRESVWQN